MTRGRVRPGFGERRRAAGSVLSSWLSASQAVKLRADADRRARVALAKPAWVATHSHSRKSSRLRSADAWLPRSAANLAS
jgi:hypothetical protein